MNKAWQTLRPAIVCFTIMTILCGVLYAGTLTGIAQLFFRDKANGSIMTVSGMDGQPRAIGSALIGQPFSSPGYLIGRPAGPTNLSPVSVEESARVQERQYWLLALDPGNQTDIPLELVTASASGVDPYISPAAAEWQVARIARARGIDAAAVRMIIQQCTVPRLLDIWGETGVHVLKVNLALDGLRPVEAAALGRP